ncbi:MAG TPA: DinB family protein [Bryobacteraceae bacterium]|nr:DinB family protein [Bryobacteraceae bacterium]
MSHPALIEELRDYYEQIENIQEDAQELTAPLNDAQFNWRPSPKQWSISECLAHLNVTAALDVPVIAAEIERGRGAGMTAAGPFRYGFFSKWFVGFMDAPPKFRVGAPKVYRPVPGLLKHQVVPEFLALHGRMLELIASANGLDLARIKVPSPAGPVKFPLGQRIALIAAHDRRHLWQAWAVRKHRGFPL